MDLDENLDFDITPFTKNECYSLLSFSKEKLEGWINFLSAFSDKISPLIDEELSFEEMRKRGVITISEDWWNQVIGWKKVYRIAEERCRVVEYLMK